MPRIIAGSAKSIRLATLSGSQARPTGDRAKEALFSILSPRLPAAGFLDLYSGSGQIGLEAASRGSTDVVLVEKDRGCQKIIQENIARTGLDASVKLVPGDVRRVLPGLLCERRRFEIIYLDPPYKTAVADFLSLAQPLGGLLTENGILVLEHFTGDETPANVMNLQLSRRCQYGSAMLSFYYHHDV